MKITETVISLNTPVFRRFPSNIKETTRNIKKRQNRTDYISETTPGIDDRNNIFGGKITNSPKKKKPKHTHSKHNTFLAQNLK